MRARVFRSQPEDVQQSIGLVLSLFKEGKEPYAVYGEAIRLACRTLKVMAKYEGGRARWELSKRWRERLELAGLDPKDPMKVTDRRRWNLAWKQMNELETFRDDVQVKWLAQGVEAPEAGERVRAIACYPKKVGETFEQYLSKEQKKKLKLRH